MAMTRTTGLILLVLGTLTFLGTTQQHLPAEAFFPGMVVCVLGTYVFLKANHVAMQASEEHSHKQMHHRTRSAGGDVSNQSQAAVDGARLAALGDRPVAVRASVDVASNDELTLYEVDASEADEAVPGLETEEDVAEAQASADAKAAEKGDKEGKSDFVVTTDVSFPLELQEQGSLADQRWLPRLEGRAWKSV